jgi:NADP-dependent 3-hydroxy acid dehydrogenase YdfG
LAHSNNRRFFMNHTLDFRGKVALVTGAASGMGLAAAKAFAEAGAAVAMADFREETVRTEAERLTAAGHTVIAMRCDVSDDAQVEQMVERTVAELGRLDAAFNNAGVMARVAPTAESSREEWDPRHEYQSAGRLELHEVRTASDGAPGQRRDCKQRLRGALTGNPGIGA